MSGYMLAGTSTTISAAAANVGTTLESAVVGITPAASVCEHYKEIQTATGRCIFTIYQRPVLKR